MLRKFSREFAKTPEAEEFLQILPHRYYEENNMHMMIVTGIKDYETCLAEVKKFLPYINNWATCLHRNVLRSTEKNFCRRSEVGSLPVQLIRSVMGSVC